MTYSNKLTYLLISLLALMLVACGGEAGEEESTADQPATLPQSGRSMQLKELPLGSPESIIGDGTHYYVSNVGEELKPSEKDGDGYIMKLDGEGQVVAEKFIEGLDAPKGSAIVGGTFYVADIDKVRMYDLASGEAKGEIDFSSTGTQFLNDICQLGNNLAVSATDINKIYKIKLSDGSFEEIETRPTVQKPNGLAYDEGNKALYVVTYPAEPQGVVGKIDMSEAKGGAYGYEVLNPFVGMLDGVAVVGDKCFFSDWNRRTIIILDLASGQVGGFQLPAQVEGPADFYLDADKGEIWLPGMVENSITIQTL